MELITTYGKEIVSLLIPFITWFLNVGIKAKAKLIWGSPHSFTFLVQEPLRDAEGKVITPTQRVPPEGHRPRTVLGGCRSGGASLGAARPRGRDC